MFFLFFIAIPLLRPDYQFEGPSNDFLVRYLGSDSEGFRARYLAYVIAGLESEESEETDSCL